MCALNVASWADKQLDELVDLLRSADFSGVASFLSQNFMIGTGSRIMDDSTQTPMRITVGSNAGTVSLSPGVFQHAGKIGHVDTAQIINILLPSGPGNWGPGKVADAATRWSIISIKQAEQFNTVEQRWFVDDTVTPNIYSQQPTNTLINKAYYDIVVTHGSSGGGIPATPTGYFTICEIQIPAGCVNLGLASIYDTVDPSQATPKNWFIPADAPNPTTRVLRLEFLTAAASLFGIDHQVSDGHHKPGLWQIGGTPVTSSGAEINKLHLTSANVNPANLNTLTGGPASDASALHRHGGTGYILILDEKTKGTEGGGFTLNTWTTRNLTIIKNDDTGAVTLLANQFTLPAGTYIADILVPAIDVKSHKAILWNVTGGSTQLTGSTASAGTLDWDESLSIIRGKFTIVAPTIFEIRHICERTQATYGLGRKSSFTDPSLTLAEVYTQVQLTKVS